MSDKPVSDLIDQLKLMRVELGDLKKRQVSEERLTHLQAAMEDTASKIESVRESAAIGALEGTKQLRELLDFQFERTSIKVDGAVNSLSEARREASGTYWPVGGTCPHCSILSPYRACYRRFAFVGSV